jgi:toxin YoeB
LLDAFRRDLTFWIGSEPRVALRVMRLIDDVLREPYSGIGKPEPLKYGSGWSRRITEEHRMVYELTSAGPEFLTADTTTIADRIHESRENGPGHRCPGPFSITPTPAIRPG